MYLKTTRKILRVEDRNVGRKAARMEAGIEEERREDAGRLGGKESAREGTKGGKGARRKGVSENMREGAEGRKEGCKE